MSKGRLLSVAPTRLTASDRASFSLVEILVASAILAAALIPLSESFHVVIFGFKHTTESTHGAFLAQSVMENIRYRLYNLDSRYCKLNASEAERKAAIERKDYETFFKELAEADHGQCIEVREGTGSSTSKYFLHFEKLQGTTLHGIRPDTSPRLFQELKDYSIEVQVSFDDVPAIERVGLDPTQQVDLARVTVIVSWLDRNDEHRESRYSTVLTRYLYEPHDKSEQS